MRDDEFALGRVLAQERRRFVEVLDVGADIEGLSAAIAFSQERLADDQRIEGRDEGAHRQAIDWRRSDDGHLPDARHRQLQRARNRCRRERQHVDFRPQLLEPLLVPNAKMLLLVHDDEAEVLEAHGLAKTASVPTTMSTPPSARPFLTSRLSAARPIRESWPTLTGKPAKRWRKF